MSKTMMYSEKLAKNARLIIFTNGTGVEEIDLIASGVLGRKLTDSDSMIQVESPIVSRKHGEFAVLEGDYYYRDLDSLNGTFINGTLYGKGMGNLQGLFMEYSRLSLGIRRSV